MVVFIALSGGVDSAVAGYILKNEYAAELVGISHIVWPESKCCDKECIDQNRLFCKDLEIPCYSIDCLVAFCRAVVDPFVHSTKSDFERIFTGGST